MGKHSLGVLVDSFDISHKTVSMIYNLNLLCERHNVIVFYNQLSDFMFRNIFSILPMREMYTFNGVGLATCDYTTKQLINSLCTKRKLFYIWDFEWNEARNYLESYEIYLNNNIELIARSRSHKKLIENCWKKPLLIEDFDHEQLEHLLNKS